MTDEDSLIRSYICGNSQTDEPVYYLPPENLNELCRRLRTEQEIAARLIVQGNLRPKEVFQLLWKDLELKEDQGVIQTGEPPADRRMVIDSDRLIQSLKREEQASEEKVFNISYEDFRQDLDSACDETLKPFSLWRGKLLKLAKKGSEAKLDKFFGLGEEKNGEDAQSSQRGCLLKEVELSNGQR